MKADAGRKKVVLELGGNAGVIVDETADLDWAVARLVFGAFAYAGQVCISVQRIYVVESIYPEFERRFVEKVREVKMGDPLDPASDLGPMVDEAAVTGPMNGFGRRSPAVPARSPAAAPTACSTSPPSWPTSRATPASAGRRCSRRS